MFLKPTDLILHAFEFVEIKECKFIKLFFYFFELVLDFLVFLWQIFKIFFIVFNHFFFALFFIIYLFIQLFDLLLHLLVHFCSILSQFIDLLNHITILIREGIEFLDLILIPFLQLGDLVFKKLYHWLFIAHNINLKILDYIEVFTLENGL